MKEFLVCYCEPRLIIKPINSSCGTRDRRLESRTVDKRALDPDFLPSMGIREHLAWLRVAWLTRSVQGEGQIILSCLKMNKVCEFFSLIINIWSLIQETSHESLRTLSIEKHIYIYIYIYMLFQINIIK